MDNTATFTGNTQKVVRFRCTGCNTSLKAPGYYAGKKVKCAKCSQSLQVPALQEVQKVVQDLNSVICICASCKHVFKKALAEPDHRIECPDCGYVFDVTSEVGQVSTDDILRFQCDFCRQNFCVLSKYAGKKFRCLNCRDFLVIPKVSTNQLELVNPKLLESSGNEDANRDGAPVYQLKQEDDEPDVLPPQEFDMNQLQPATTSRRGKKKTKAQDVSVMSKLKIPLIAVAGVLGFLIGFLVVSSLFKGSAEKEAVPVQVPEAIAMAEEIITQLHQMKIDEVADIFSDEVMVDAGLVRELAYSVSLGTIDKIDSTVTFSRIEEGAAGYIVESAVTYAGQFTRTLQSGFVMGEQIVPDDEGYYDNQAYRSLMSLAVLDSDGTELNAIGETTDYLITKLNTFVDENSTISAEALGMFSCGFMFGLLCVLLLVLICQAMVFSKAGEPGWGAFVPIYNVVIMARIAGESEAKGLFCVFSGFIPFVGGFIQTWLMITFSIGIANNFGKGTLFGLGLAFLPFIFYPILAFSGGSYD